MLNLQAAVALKAARRTNVKTPPPLVEMSLSKSTDSEDEVGSDVALESVHGLSLHEDV